MGFLGPPCLKTLLQLTAPGYTAHAGETPHLGEVGRRTHEGDRRCHVRHSQRGKRRVTHTTKTKEIGEVSDQNPRGYLLYIGGYIIYYPVI